MSDGPYGIGGYPGDPTSYDKLTEVYKPHVEAWSRKATPQTTLWFWGTELGWATVHPLLSGHGWIYRSLNVWDKGVAHIAGNVNTGTIRSFPVVTEVCAHYTREPAVLVNGVPVTGGAWLRAEWVRTGLPLSKANEACLVADAATRKWLTLDSLLWYPPPPEKYKLLRDYANQHGDPKGAPYFSPDLLRAKFECPYGVTNVWSVRSNSRGLLHPNEKPLTLVKRLVCSSTEVGDVVWEPFGGSCPTAYVCKDLERTCFSAEIHPEFAGVARQRLENHTISFDKAMALFEAD